jgi:hypothetical protein
MQINRETTKECFLHRIMFLGKIILEHDLLYLSNGGSRRISGDPSACLHNSVTNASAAWAL